MKRCLSCFKEYDDTYEVCPFCGTESNVLPKEPIHLKPGTFIGEGNRYLLGLAINSGGFGIIYRAYDMKFGSIVAVKEFFPTRLVTRAADGKKLVPIEKGRDEFEYRKKRFLLEARYMALFGSHPNIPNVYEYFDENNTAYIVMEFLTGCSLSEYIDKNADAINPDFANYIANEVGKALIAFHDNGIIHRDVAPDNIFIVTDGGMKIKLLDCGAAKFQGEDDNTIDIILKPGYSPVEQYNEYEKVDARADIYALGATLYAMLTGVKPTESTNRETVDDLQAPKELNPSIGDNLNNAIMKAMAVHSYLRFKNVEEFLRAINGEKKIFTLKNEKRIRKTVQILGVLLALSVIVFCGTLASKLYSEKRLEVELEPATISVWYGADEGSGEQAAMEQIKADFESVHEGVIVELTRIDDENYEEELLLASENNSLPNLFESTGISQEITAACVDVDTVLQSEMASNCLFLNQYDEYYSDHKRMPLAFEVPVAAIINNGPVSCSYGENTFSRISDFYPVENISLDLNSYSLWESMIDVSTCVTEDDFLAEPNRTAILLTTSTEITRVDNSIIQYQHHFSFFGGTPVNCRFMYEWSIGTGDENQVRASERMLSYMLGNRYQDYLLLSTNTETMALPLCQETLENKIATLSIFFSGMSNNYDNYLFINEANNGEVIDIELPSVIPTATPTPTPVPLTPTEEYVVTLYNGILGRDPDPIGMESFVAIVEENEGNPEIALRDMFNSAEFANRNLTNEEFVNLLFNVILGRAPDENGYNTFMGMLEEGTTREALLDSFFNSQEWLNRVDEGII